MGCLNDAGARFAAVGGLAVGVRCLPRFTMDIDLAVAVANDAEAERVLAPLIRTGFRPIMELTHTPTARLATIRLAPPGVSFLDIEEEQPPIVDLLFASCGIEPEVVADATPFAVYPDVTLPVAQAPHLIAMKVLSLNDERLKDLGDLQALVTAATPEQVGQTRRLVRLIVSRGYHQGRDLLAEFENHLRRMGKDVG